VNEGLTANLPLKCRPNLVAATTEGSGMQRQKFGEIALQLGFLTESQVTRALSIQEREENATQPRRPLGIICMQEGYLTFDQVVQILARQEAKLPELA
jgi:hypothetical protein